MLKKRIRKSLIIIKRDGFIYFIKKVYIFFTNRFNLFFSRKVKYYRLTDENYISYINKRFEEASIKIQDQPEYVDKTLENLENLNFSVKLVCFYLPQFYPFSENNKWWGDGFTEWTNVTKANPQFIGHNQPNLPGEMGFYDLRLTNEVMSKQIKLAKKYGIQGFCFYHYWFDGKRLMDLPVDNFLHNINLDIEFCLCWANENWTRRWDGEEDNILIKQNHSESDDREFFRDIIKYLKDPRYIKVNDKPLLMIYRVNILPDVKKTISIWRKMASEEGLSGLYVVAVRSFDNFDAPDVYGCDATVEFPPHQKTADLINQKLDIINKQYKGNIYSYESLVKNELKKGYEGYVNFKTVFPSWDNEARKPGYGDTYHGSTPELYAEWLRYSVEYALEYPPEGHEQGIVFVNAWNEWAEGAYLEPDRRFGYAYLQATANVMRNIV